MKTLSILITIIAAVSFVGCATTPEAKLKQAYKRAKKTPFEQLPALYVKLEQEEKITSSTREHWTEAWNVANKKHQQEIAAHKKEQQRLADKRRREWEALTPAQRYNLEMRERELQQQQDMIAFQAEQQRRANIQSAVQGFSDSLQHQQEINAYNARTDALSRPLNVNVNGNINHNVNHRYPYYNP